MLEDVNIGVEGIEWLKVIIALEVIVALVVVIIVTIVIMRLLKYNLLAWVEEKTEFGTYVYHKRAKIVVDNKDRLNPVEKIKLLGVKNVWAIMPPTYVLEQFKNKEGQTDKSSVSQWYKSLYALTKRGRKCIRLLRDGAEITAIPFTNVDVENYLRITKPVRVQWANSMFREGLEMYKPEANWVEKYGSLIAFGGAMLVILIIFIVLFEKFEMLEQMSGAINNYSDQLAEYVKALREVNTQTV